MQVAALPIRNKNGRLQVSLRRPQVDFIQRAENRGTQSIHAKLDEVLHAHSMASNAMTSIDEVQPEDIEQHRKDAWKDD